MAFRYASPPSWFPLILYIIGQSSRLSVYGTSLEGCNEVLAGIDPQMFTEVGKKSLELLLVNAHYPLTKMTLHSSPIPSPSLQFLRGALFYRVFRLNWITFLFHLIIQSDIVFMLADLCLRGCILFSFALTSLSVNTEAVVAFSWNN